MTQKATWKCKNCKETFVTQYEENDVTEKFEIEEYCYSDYCEHIVDCLGEDHFEMVSYYKGNNGQ